MIKAAGIDEGWRPNLLVQHRLVSSPRFFERRGGIWGAERFTETGLELSGRYVVRRSQPSERRIGVAKSNWQATEALLNFVHCQLDAAVVILPDRARDDVVDNLISAAFPRGAPTISWPSLASQAVTLEGLVVRTPSCFDDQEFVVDVFGRPPIVKRLVAVLRLCQDA